jgi:catechol 2,3-dioxygenase-like lactoylglutathione lyase family enzyme
MPELMLDHVVIAVTDLDAATRDYIALLGREPSWRGEHPSYGTRNTLFRIDNTYVELLSLGGGGFDPRWAGELARFLDVHGEGLMSLAIGTGDVDATAAALRKSGVEVVDPADGEGIDATTGARRIWRNALVPPKSTNGARIFVIQHKSLPDALPVARVIGGPGAHVERMDHAVVLSADMEEARRVWHDKIGARLALDRTFPERNTRILFFRLGDITIEISGGAEQAKEGMGKQDRLWGLAWGVGNLEATCDRLAQAGILTSGPRPGIKPGTLVATAKGPSTHGVATLLIEHTPRSFEPESRAAHGLAYDNTEQKRAFTATGLDHVVLSTSDLEATTAKWASILDLYAAESGRPKGTGFRVAKLPAGNAFVELVQPISGGHRIARRIAEHGQGMYSISVRVDNLDAAIADLRAKGVPVSDPDPGIWAGTRIARIPKTAANGVSLQLIEHEAT